VLEQVALCAPTGRWLNDTFGALAGIVAGAGEGPLWVDAVEKHIGHERRFRLA
jgi:hypothetical protein